MGPEVDVPQHSGADGWLCNGFCGTSRSVPAAKQRPLGPAAAWVEHWPWAGHVSLLIPSPLESEEVELEPGREEWLWQWGG